MIFVEVIHRQGNYDFLRRSFCLQHCPLKYVDTRDLDGEVLDRWQMNLCPEKNQAQLFLPSKLRISDFFSEKEVLIFFSVYLLEETCKLKNFIMADNSITRTWASAFQPGFLGTRRYRHYNIGFPESAI